MSYLRTIKFDFCQMFCKTSRKQEEYALFDIELIIHEIEKQELVRQEVDVLEGLKVRIERFDYNAESHLWSLRIFRLRDENISYIVKKEEEAKPIELGDDEYIGEDMTMLFDIENNVAMIQRNRYAMGFKNLEKLVQKIIGKEKLKIEIRPISKELDPDKIRKDYFKSLEIRFANVQGKDIDSIGGSLGNIIKSYNGLGGYSGGFIVNLGRSRKESLAKEPVRELLCQISDHRDFLSGAVLRAKDQEADDVDIINLLDNVFSIFISFNIPKKTTLSYDYCTRKMTEKFVENRQLIKELLER